jgi:hypothetical protein
VDTSAGIGGCGCRLSKKTPRQPVLFPMSKYWAALWISPLAPSDGMSITTCSIPATPLVAISTSIRSHLPLHEIDIHISGKVIKAGIIDSGSRISLAATLRSQFRTQQTHPSLSLSPPVHRSGSTCSSNYVNSCASAESPHQRPLVHKPSRSTAHSSLLS